MGAAPPRDRRGGSPLGRQRRARTKGARPPPTAALSACRDSSAPGTTRQVPRPLIHALDGGLAPWFHVRMLGNGERVLVVGLRAGDAEVAGKVAEDLGDGPEGNQHRVGSGGPRGEG